MGVYPVMEFKNLLSNEQVLVETDGLLCQYAYQVVFEPSISTVCCLCGHSPRYSHEEA